MRSGALLAGAAVLAMTTVAGGSRATMASQEPEPSTITSQPFGTVDGQTVYLYTLTSATDQKVGRDAIVWVETVRSGFHNSIVSAE